MIYVDVSSFPGIVVLEVAIGNEEAAAVHGVDRCPRSLFRSRQTWPLWGWPCLASSTSLILFVLRLEAILVLGGIFILIVVKALLPFALSPLAAIADTDRVMLDHACGCVVRGPYCNYYCAFHVEDTYVTGWSCFFGGASLMFSILPGQGPLWQAWLSDRQCGCDLQQEAGCWLLRQRVSWRAWRANLREDHCYVCYI